MGCCDDILPIYTVGCRDDILPIYTVGCRDDILPIYTVGCRDDPSFAYQGSTTAYSFREQRLFYNCSLKCITLLHYYITYSNKFKCRDL